MFLPENIDLAHSEKYILSIRIGSNSFMFTISDPENPGNFCFRETSFTAGNKLTENIQRIIFDLNFLTQQFLSTNVVFVSDNYESVPQKYYIGKQVEELYYFTHTRPEGEAQTILSSENVSQRTFTLYPVNKSLYEFLTRNLYNPVFHHHSDLLTQYWRKKKQLGDSEKRMYLYFHREQMDIYSFVGTQQIHSIGYKGNHMNNPVYFILKTWEAVGFNQVEDYLFIAGQYDSGIIPSLKEYLKHIESYTLPSEVHLWNEDATKAPLDLLVLSL